MMIAETTPTDLSFGSLVRPFVSDASRSTTGSNSFELTLSPDAVLRRVPSFSSWATSFVLQLTATASSQTLVRSLLNPQVLYIDDLGIPLGALTSFTPLGTHVVHGQRSRGPEHQPLANPKSISDALEEIRQITGLPKQHIAELLGISRVTLHKWSLGAQTTVNNERRIRSTLDVLLRARDRFERPDQVTAWLTTPRGPRAISPMTLLGQGKIDEARLLTLSTMPHRTTPLSQTLLSGPLDQSSEREHARRDLITRESDQAD